MWTRLMFWLLCHALFCTSGCNALQEIQGECLLDSECDARWQLCDQETQLCVRKQELRTCQLLAAGDVCGVGATCENKEGTGVCVPRPLKVVVITSTIGNPLSGHEGRYDSVIRHVNQNLATKLKDPQDPSRSWSFELSHKVTTISVSKDPERFRDVLKTLLQEDVDMVITLQSSAYKEAAEFFAPHKTLVFGRYNRRSDVVQSELAENPNNLGALTPTGVPLREIFPDRFDFSLVPVQINDAAVIANFSTSELGCQSISVGVELESQASMLWDTLVRSESDRHGLCVSPALDVSGPEKLASFYQESLEILDAMNVESQCIYFHGPAKPGAVFFLKTWLAQGNPIKAKFLLRPSWLQSELGELLQTHEDRGQFHFVDYGNENEQSKLFVENYINQDYTKVYEEVCAKYEDCVMAPPQALSRNVLAVSLDFDLVIVSLLSLYKAQVDHGANPSNQQLRDSFLELLEVDHVVCRHSESLDCFERILIGQPVHYDGLGSPMVLGTDGRMNRVYETMEFSRFIEADMMERTKAYSSKQMLQAHREPRKQLSCP